MSKALSSFRRATALATLRRGRASLSLSPTPIACTSASTMSLHTTPVHGNSHRHRNGYRSGAQIARSRLVGVPADRGGAGIDDLIEPKLVVSRTSNNVAAGYQEWTKGLDTTEMSLALDEFLRRPMIRELSAEQGISNKLFITAFRSFRQYCLSETSNVEPALLIVFSDIAKEGHDVDRLFPYFLSHARKVFPHLEAMDELRMVSDLSHPHNWYPDARMLQRKIIFHAGPTNSGKTYHALKRFSEAKSGIYCGPLKLLAAEVFTRSNELGLKCDMVTGEERRYAIDSHHPSAHLSSTVEMLATAMRVEVAVIDEIQMLRDEQRGWAWTRALLGVAADEVHLCGEVAAIDIVKKLLDPIGEHVEVHTYERKTSLTIGTHGVDRLDNIEPGDCIVCFSKKAIFGITKKLEEIGIKPAVIYGDLPPATKLAQAAKFNDPNDPCNVLVSTDAIGMGLNLNIRRVIFQSCTRTGELLPNYAALQIAGRAGRFGTAYANGVATTLRNEDIGTLRDILAKPVEPITSVGIAPTFEQIETFSFHLPQASFVKLLDLFVSVCSVSDHFFICTVDQMKELAVLIDYIPLPLKVRYTFCTCPMKIENKMSEMAFVKMARRFSSGQCLTWEWLSGIIGWPQLPPINITELMALEKVYEIMDAYLWLSLRFSDMMPDEIEVREATRELDKLICEGIDNFTELLANEQGRPQGKQGSMAKKARERAQTQRDKKELADSEKVNENAGTAKDLQFPDKRRGRRKIIQEFMRNKETLTKDDVEELKKLIDGLDKNDANKEEK